LFEWRPMPRARRYVLAIGAWIAATCAGLGANAVLTDRPMHFWQSSLAVMDIVGTLHHLDEDLPDTALRAIFAGTEIKLERDLHAELRARFVARSYQTLVRGPLAVWDLPISAMRSHARGGRSCRSTSSRICARGGRRSSW
jgi:hypothetical protein